MVSSVPLLAGKTLAYHLLFHLFGLACNKGTEWKNASAAICLVMRTNRGFGCHREGPATQRLVWDRNIFEYTWWRHQIETFSALLALCEGNSLVTGEFPSPRTVTRSFDVFVDLRLNKRLSKPSRRRWFEAPSNSIWRHHNDLPCS